MKPIIIAIVGDSGSGKTYVAVNDYPSLGGLFGGWGRLEGRRLFFSGARYACGVKCGVT